MAVRFLVTGGNGLWNSTTNWSATSGGAPGASFPVAGDTANLNSAANIQVNVTSACAVLDMTGYSGTMSGAAQLTTTGNVTLGGTVTYAGIWILAGTSGTQVWTSNGKSTAATVRVNGVGGTVQFADAFSTTGGLQLSNGTLDTNSVSISALTYSLNAGTKVLQLKNSQWSLSFSGAGRVWDTSTNSAGYTQTTSGGSKLTFTGSAGTATVFTANGQPFDDIAYTGTNSFSFSGSNNTYRDLRISNAAAVGTATFGNATWRNIDLTGYSGTWNDNLGLNLTGDMTLSAAMTLTGTAAVSFTGTGAQNLTTVGKTITFLTRVIGTANTLHMLDTFTSSAGVQIDNGNCGIVSKAGVTNTCKFFRTLGIVGTPCSIASDTPGTPTTWNCDGTGSGSGSVGAGKGESGAVGNGFRAALNVTDVHVGGGSRWWAGAGNDNGGNYGWRFTDWNVRGLPRFAA